MENPILLPLNDQSEEQLRARLALATDEINHTRQQGRELNAEAEDSFIVHEHFMAAHEAYMALHAEFARRRGWRQTAENRPQV